MFRRMLLLLGMLAVGAVLGAAESSAQSGGLQFALTARGLSALSYNGQSFFYAPDMSGGVTFKTPGGAIAGSYYLDPSSGAVIKTFGSNFVQHIYNSGNGNQFTIKVVFTALDSKTLQADTAITNGDSTNALTQFNLEALEVQLPSAAREYDANIPIYTGAHTGGSPVGFLSNTWGSLAFWQSDYSGNAGFAVTYGSAAQTQFRLGFANNYTSPSGVHDDPIAPGATKHYITYYRFGTSTDTPTTLAPEGFSSFRTSWPYLVNWSDRRPIARWFISDGSHVSATNPRGYLWNPALDVSNQSAFSAAVLASADSTISYLNTLNPKPQGVLIWDLEGQEFAQVFTYVGNPNQLGAISPEMGAVADQLISKLQNAGFPVGLTLRPSNFSSGTTLPQTCATGPDTTFPGMVQQDVFIKTDAPYPFRGYACTATNTWTQAGSRLPYYQTLSNTDSTTLSNLVSKVTYARSRWGIKFFYVDSTVYSNGGAFDFTIFRALEQQFPDTLFFPENENTQFYEATAPYNQANMGTFATSSKALDIYPQAFSLIESHGINAADPAQYNNLLRSVVAGNILTIDGWYHNPDDDAVMQAYRDAAGASTGDTQAPTAPSSPSATALSAAQVRVAWTTSTDNVFVLGYDVYRNGSLLAHTSALSYTDSTVSAATQYSYTVKAHDSAGNNSGFSTPATVTTPRDNVATLAPSSLRIGP